MKSEDMVEESSLPWYKNYPVLMELVIIPFIFLFLISFVSTEEELKLQSTDGLFAFSIFFWLIFFLYKKYISKIDIRDTQFRILFHLLVILVATFTSTHVFNAFGVWTPKSTPDGPPPIFIPLALYFLIVVGAFLNLMEISSDYRNAFNELEQRVLEGDFSTQITNESLLNDSVFAPLARLTNNLVVVSNELVKTLSDSIIDLSETSQELSSISEEVNASSEEISSTTTSMSQGAAQQSDMMTDITNQLNQITKIIDEIVLQIQNNTQQSSQIALQTNILALNAGIEASRAGDYGRGFAVVAENVRKLSDESKAASENTAEVANSIQETLQIAFDDISRSVTSIIAISEETAASAQEVAAGSEEVTASMQNMSEKALELMNLTNRSSGIINKYTIKE